MKSVAFALPNGLELGGVTVWSMNLARSLAAAGFQVNILEHVLEDAIPVATPDPLDVPRLELRGAPFALSKSEMRRFSQVYSQALPGLIVPNYSTGTYATCAMLSRQHAARLRVVGFAHTDDEEYYEHLQFYEPIIHRFVAVSDMIRDRLEERIPHRSGDILVQPYGVRIPPDFVHHYSEPSGPIRLLYAGRLVEMQKRISDLLRLIEDLDRRNVDFELNIAGEGADASAFVERLRTFSPDVQRRVALLGRLPHAQMERLWNTSDVCVLTSEYEGCSIAMLEAMAHGCVPVVTAVSGTRMFIRQDENGYTVPVGDMDAMGATIARLAHDRDRLPVLGHRAHAAVSERCSYSAYVAWFMQLSESVWDEPVRVWPRMRLLFRPTAQELLTRSSKFVQRRQPRLYDLYKRANVQIRRAFRQESLS